MVHAAIFDMDGLLIESDPFWIAVKKNVFHSIGIDIPDYENAKTTGMRLDEVVHMVFERHHVTTHSPREVMDKIEQKVIDLIAKKGELKPGVLHALTILKDHRVPMALATSSSPSIIQAVLEKTDIKKFFRVIHSADKELHGKPHPAVFLSAAEKLNISQEACVVFEDSPPGVIAAKAARMKCIAVPNPYIKGDRDFCIADKIYSTLESFTYDDLADL
jgi:sugar-phosphatase